MPRASQVWLVNPSRDGRCPSVSGYGLGDVEKRHLTRRGSGGTVCCEPTRCSGERDGGLAFGSCRLSGKCVAHDSRLTVRKDARADAPDATTSFALLDIDLHADPTTAQLIAAYRRWIDH